MESNQVAWVAWQVNSSVEVMAVVAAVVQVAALRDSLEL